MKPALILICVKLEIMICKLCIFYYAISRLELLSRPLPMIINMTREYPIAPPLALTKSQCWRYCNSTWQALQMCAKCSPQSYTFLKILHSTRVFWVLHSTKQGFSTVYRFPVRVSPVYWAMLQQFYSLKFWLLQSTIFQKCSITVYRNRYNHPSLNWDYGVNLHRPGQPTWIKVVISHSTLSIDSCVSDSARPSGWSHICSLGVLIVILWYQDTVFQ